ncbi:MAG: carbon-nitrogen hydrolase family protein [Bacteroidia bacterium]|nr:carbon-nitrogen hydrolase family protein [Bacteroidia bacterium]
MKNILFYLLDSGMRIAVCQLLVEGGEPERNLVRAQEMIERAVTQGCDLAILPETLDLAWTHPSVYEEAETIPGTRSDFFCQLAVKHQVWLCLGLTERSEDKIYNSAILIDPKGNIRLKHHKINLLEVEFPFYEAGQKLEVVDTEWGKIGLNICADNYADALCLGHSLARMGAQLILTPSSWTVDHSVTEEQDPYRDKWLKPLGELATTYEIPVVSATSVGYIVGGPYEGKKMIGCSLTVDKHGKTYIGEKNEFAGDLKIIQVELGSQQWKGTQFGKMINEKQGKR